MKFHYALAAGITAFAFCLGGCAHAPSYDPSVKPDASADVVKVVSMRVEPAKPIAPEPWRVTMKIKNTSSQPLENIAYQFLLGGKGEQLGKGEIPRLDPGATVNVTSDVAKVQNGTYRVEGRVFLQKDREPEFSGRMNNWMTTNVVVAQ